MHYESTAFAIDRNVPTIYAKNGGVLGNSKGFSPVRYPFELIIMAPPPTRPPAVRCISFTNRFLFFSFRLT